MCYPITDLAWFLKPEELDILLQVWKEDRVERSS